MTIIEQIRTFIETCPLLINGREIYIDELKTKATSMGIFPTPGATVLSKDILGNITREVPFTLMSKEITFEEVDRIANTGLYENFVMWLEEVDLPDLGPGREALKVEATAWGYLSGTDPNLSMGVYQINCKLTYKEKGASL